eukprot:m.67867 g.67867  ORF g.67867 m.67867 type:complete len:356 (+) comp13863_c0_seq2:172-1239(+)
MITHTHTHSRARSLSFFRSCSFNTACSFAALSAVEPRTRTHARTLALSLPFPVSLSLALSPPRTRVVTPFAADRDNLTMADGAAGSADGPGVKRAKKSAPDSAKTGGSGAAAAAAASSAPKKKPSKKKKSKASGSGTAGGAGADGQADASATCPRAAREVATILKAMGAQKHDPRVVVQLLEFSHRYIHDVLDDATCYAEYRAAGPDAVPSLKKEDVRLAVQSRVDFSYSAPPPREFLMEVASNKNAQPLPTPTPGTGLRLPPEKHCLVKPTYTVLPSNRRAPAASGPWYLPSTETAIAAAQQAKKKRRERKRKHTKIEENKEEDERDATAQAPSALLKATDAAGGDGDEDDFDA